MLLVRKFVRNEKAFKFTKKQHISGFEKRVSFSTVDSHLASTKTNGLPGSDLPDRKISEGNNLEKISEDPNVSDVIFKD